MTLKQAACKLRAHLGFSQQDMAAWLRLSMGAVRNYESGAVRAPNARAAAAYLMAAEGNGRPDLATVFQVALQDAVGLPVTIVSRSLTIERPETPCTLSTKAHPAADILRPV
jgi:transcriptional regulator with XRE-family HTH domain